MAVRSSVGRRGKGVNVGRSICGVWEDVEVVAGKPTLDASLHGALFYFILGDEMNEASLVPSLVLDT